MRHESKRTFRIFGTFGAAILLSTAWPATGAAGGSDHAQGAAGATLADAPARTGAASHAAPAAGDAASDEKHARPRPVPSLLPSARRFYQQVWGIDILGVKPVSSGSLLRFSYRVLDPQKARTLNDKKSAPVLIDYRTHAALVVPTMEKVGQLRQTPTPEAGREYWMLFSNKGNLVGPGSRVDVVIGTFRASGLIVQPG